MPTAYAETYLHTATYRTMLDRLVEAYADPGHDLRTRLIEVIGEAGVWPMFCLEDRQEERRLGE